MISLWRLSPGCRPEWLTAGCGQWEPVKTLDPPGQHTHVISSVKEGNAKFGEDMEMRDWRMRRRHLESQPQEKVKEVEHDSEKVKVCSRRGFGGADVLLHAHHSSEEGVFDFTLRQPDRAVRGWRHGSSGHSGLHRHVAYTDGEGATSQAVSVLLSVFLCISVPHAEEKRPRKSFLSILVCIFIKTCMISGLDGSKCLNGLQSWPLTPACFTLTRETLHASSVGWVWKNPSNIMKNPKKQTYRTIWKVENLIFWKCPTSPQFVLYFISDSSDIYRTFLQLIKRKKRLL